MSGSSGRQNKIDYVSRVGDQIRQLHDKAKQLGKRRVFVHTFETILEKLATSPLEWADTLYRMKKQGGVFCRGILAPLVVYFAYYDLESVVLMLDVEAMSNTWLS